MKVTRDAKKGCMQLFHFAMLCSVERLTTAPMLAAAVWRAFSVFGCSLSTFCMFRLSYLLLVMGLHNTIILSNPFARSEALLTLSV